MTRAIRAELLKLRRPRLLWGSLGALFGFTLLVSILSVATATETAGPRAVSIARLVAADGLTIGFGNASRLVGLVILVLFLSSATTEYSFGTIRILLTRQPDRITVLGGKLGALLVAMTAALLAAFLLSVASATLTMLARGLPVDAWFTGAGLGHAVVGYGNALVACALYGAFGLTFGVLLRSTVLAVGVMLGWFFMAENIAATIWSGAPHWLPGLLAGVVMAGGTDTVAYWPALAATLAYLAVAVAVAGVVFARRDVF
jgi:ABC-2 type transport system permease protein